MVHFSAPKKSVIVWAKYLNASERSYLAVLENAMDYWSGLPLARCQPLKIQGFGIFCWLSSIFGISHEW